MLIPFEELKKYKYTYLEKMVNKNIPEGNIYQYAPYLLMTSKYQPSYREVNYHSNPLLKMLIDTVKIINYCNDNYSIGTLKSILITTLQSLPTDKESKEYTIVIEKLCTTCIDKLKQMQYNDKLLESAIINYSPIVPYTAIIRKPVLDSVENEYNKNTDNKMNNIDIAIKILYLSDEEIYNFIKSIILSIPTQILKSYDKLIKVDNYDNQYSINSEDTIKLSDDVLNIVTSNSFDLVSIYYMLVYIYYTYDRNQYSKIIDILKSINKAFNKDDSVNIATALEALNKINLPAIEDSILSPENINNMEYENNKQMEEIMKTGNIDSEDTVTKNFNLNKLLSYIYTTLKYKTDAYTNNLFLNNNKSISGYSFISNGNSTLLVCEIDKSILGIPVIDIADNYKMKLITIDKDDNIQVTTNFDTK